MRERFLGRTPWVLLSGTTIFSVGMGGGGLGSNGGLEADELFAFAVLAKMVARREDDDFLQILCQSKSSASMGALRRFRPDAIEANNSVSTSAERRRRRGYK